MTKLLVFCLFLGLAAQAQELYMPRNIKKAIQQRTRSLDGRPGPAYWQNQAHYVITITATPPSRTIQGTEQITYINHSPDTLRSLVFKLILNSHQPGAIRLNTVSPDYLTSGIHIDQYAENNIIHAWPPPTSQTWQPVPLTQALLPQDSVKLSIGWHYELSRQSNREGLLDSTTFYLAYFYPRVAVYDDYYGWDVTDFTEAQEFYNDFNDYLLQVQVPANYLVWSTGTLLNPQTVLQAPVAQRLAASMQTDSLIHVATLEEIEANKITAQQPLNTWRWRADQVSDIALCLSNQYVWDAASVVVDKTTGRRASVQAAFKANATDFQQMVRFGRHALDWLSTQWPGTPYPYPKTTLVQGFADMEYPMMVNDATNADLTYSRFVAEHELAHSWFPFYMGINETRYGFMDEGWTTAFEYLISQADVGLDQARRNFQYNRVRPWSQDPSAEQDLPIITPGNVLSGMAMANNEYGKAALGYLALKDLLGDADFRTALHGFIERWHGKHPTPWDMFYSFNSVLGKDLNWFWTNWFFSYHYIDVAIEQVVSSGSRCTIRLQNIGGCATPVDVVLTYTDGTTQRFHQTPALWQAHPRGVVLKLAVSKPIQSVRLDGGIFLDADLSNNSWQVK